MIELKGVSKKYQIYSSPSDRLKEMLLRRPFHREFWALRDVSFEVPRGCTVGLVGQNGSGKSTVLQIIAGTLRPTLGDVQVRGRVSALLELGAGFNPEFTGRENVYLNGAIMGLSRAEVGKRFHAIEEFAGIGDFIDRPVKTYSSGMYVRLAFATAIHVDPDVLIVDEALAVGDLTFQHKCLRRIKALQATGCTVLFVSHDLDAVKQLCDEALLFSRGSVLSRGRPEEVAKQYVSLVMGDEAPDQFSTREKAAGSYRHGDRGAEILDVSVRSADGKVVGSPGRPARVVSGEPCEVSLKIVARRSIAEPVVGLAIRTRLGLDVYGTNTELLEVPLAPLEPGQNLDVRFAFPCRLGAGSYAVTVAVHSADRTSHDWIDDAVLLDVHGTPHCVGVADLQATVQAQASLPVT